MSWASRRRTTYLTGVIIFFTLLIGIPLVNYFLSIKPTCFDGKRNQGETAVDKGGPCLILDEHALSPWATLWARSFKVRDGTYTAVAYVVNPNSGAGVAQARYHFGLYDSGNVLIAEREGTMFIMPGSITPVLETGISTGYRVAVHTYFDITDDQLRWERMTNPATAIKLSNQEVGSTDTTPRITARVENTLFSTLRNPSFIAVAFDPYGNAIAASGTSLPYLQPGTPTQITFTWPQAFPGSVGRVDIIPLLAPQEAPLKRAK